MVETTFTQVQLTKEDRKEIRLLAIQLGLKTYEVISLLIKSYKEK